MGTFAANIRKAFSLCEVWGYQVKNRMLVHSMFYLTLEQFHYELLLTRCKSELELDGQLREFVLQIGNFVKMLQLKRS
jgi:hypothetical protein